MRIELQYNTPESLKVKSKAHAAYELFRVIKPQDWKADIAARAALYRWMSSAYDAVERPEGAAWGVTELSKISTCGTVHFKSQDGLPSAKQHPIPFVIDRGKTLNTQAILGMTEEIEKEVKAIHLKQRTQENGADQSLEG